MVRPKRILFALTSHGLGHLTRSLAIARALRELRPVELMVATSVPAERIAQDLPPPFEQRPVEYEPGTLQRSCFELDVPATLAGYARYLDERPERLLAEKRYLRESRCDAVVSDIPALPVRAACELGLPAFGVANFTWDWILAGLPGAAGDVAARLGEDYAQGGIHLRLPFGPESSPFPRSEPAPLVARRARLSARELRRRLGIPQDDGLRLAVVCPGGWPPDGWRTIRVPGCADFRFICVGDLPVESEAPQLSLPHALPQGVAFPDLVAGADVVLAKPGYGIASECALHRAPLVAIERPGFRETPVLLRAFEALGPLAALSLDDFFAGRWEAPLRQVLAGRPTWSEVPQDGAEQVARRLWELMGEAVEVAAGPRPERAR